MKTFHYLAGLHRSGNTLLSALLNQNPQIYSSPLSPIVDFYYQYDNSIAHTENVIRMKDKTGINNTLKIIDNFYQHIEKPIVIDREKSWGTEANLHLLKKYINPKPKIIFTNRPIIEILASWISILGERSKLDLDMQMDNWWYKDYLTHNDNRCDYIMRPNGPMDKGLLTYNELLKPENKDIFCIVNYSEIINEPDKTMNQIYDFLELPNYKHDFNNILKLEADDDEAIGLPANMHEIRPQLKKISKDPREILSEYVINKYSNIGWEAK